MDVFDSSRVDSGSIWNRIYNRGVENVVVDEQGNYGDDYYRFPRFFDRQDIKINRKKGYTLDLNIFILLVKKVY